MNKSIILILLLLGFSQSYTLNNYFTNHLTNNLTNHFPNYFTNLTQLEKDIIKNYALYYPNAFVVINMLI